MKELVITTEELNDLLTEHVGKLNIRTAELISDGVKAYKKCGLLPSELLKQRDELKGALAEQKRLYFNLFDEEKSCMYCEKKVKRGEGIFLCKDCCDE